MQILKEQSWLFHLFLIIITGGLYFFILAHKLDLYNSEAWYADYRYWLCAVLCFFLPVILLLIIFMFQMACTVASTVNVPGKEIYRYPYAWILCLIIPVVGWSLFLVMTCYIAVWTPIMLHQLKIK